MPPWPATDALVQATWLPSDAAVALFVWRPGARAPGADAEALDLDGVGAASGHRLYGAAMLDWLASVDASARPSASVAAFVAARRLAIELVRRAGVRPRAQGQLARPRLSWVARPDQVERDAFAAIVRALPPVACAPVRDRSAATFAADVDRPWRAVRSVVDAMVDVLVRRSKPTRRYGEGSFEAEVEAALAGESSELTRLGTGPRARRALETWEDAARATEDAKVRLVLSLAADEAGAFRLAFAATTDELGEGVVEAAALWSGAAAAHRLADDLAPARRAVREALRKAGQRVVPVEVSLASEAPASAALSAEEAWRFLATERAGLEADGVRVRVATALEGLDERTPRAGVRLARADGAPAGEASLSTRYRATWEVASGDRRLDAATLRRMAKEAPLPRIDGVFVQLGSDSAERLAKIAERETADWTGPQALAAALAGAVRQPGDLADAVVTCESGLSNLLVELGRDLEPVSPPAGLNAKLRGYQARGLAWMWHRTRLGLGALLADDMGLGKTVQLIALLELLCERGVDDGPTLVACPASLVGNWERELARFAPALKVVRHHGDARGRDAEALARRLGAHDVLVTTYGLARRDAETLQAVRWGTLVCDEAQALKNPHSAQARAVRGLVARRRVALSGTPVENRLTELWALMELLNPGLLGPLERFRRELALPIERERDARAVRWLKAATAPFLLRRLKTDPDIAPELPEKEVIRVYCSLSEEQATLYRKAVDESLAALDDAAGIERQGRVLRLLTRLKQICNHPSLVPRADEVAPSADSGGLAGRSGKLERATEMLDEIAPTGERTLVFTQYVETGRMLVAHFAQALGLEAPLFHGGLSLEERDRLVRRFQEEPDGPPVLVMSLKAGGVGLNLTRANHVVHYDRWWNPAVEDQATDRAHRIGQTRRVQVHHLVTMGTLEERIDRMLEDKRALAGAVVDGGEAWLAQLSTDELRALVSLGSDAAVESVEAWSEKG